MEDRARKSKRWSVEEVQARSEEIEEQARRWSMEEMEHGGDTSEEQASEE